MPAAQSDQLKQSVRQWVEAAINRGELELAASLCTARPARRSRTWVRPFRDAFPDAQMETVELVAEGSTVVGRFRCSATHRGEWQGQRPTGRRFEGVDEVYFFHFADGLIDDLWGIEDTTSRLRQLGLALSRRARACLRSSR